MSSAFGELKEVNKSLAQTVVALSKQGWTQEELVMFFGITNSAILRILSLSETFHSV